MHGPGASTSNAGYSRMFTLLSHLTYIGTGQLKARGLQPDDQSPA
jgi:hypothetical protein